MKTGFLVTNAKQVINWKKARIKDGVTLPVLMCNETYKTFSNTKFILGS